MIYSPSVSGSFSTSNDFKHLNVTRCQGKKATRLCPCGYYGHPSGRCRCTEEQIARYRARISGPLLDRIDLHIEVPPLPKGVLQNHERREEDSVTVRDRVVACREVQQQRSAKANAMLDNREVKKVCPLKQAEAQLLEQATEMLGLSARAHQRILKLARTIADMAGSKSIEANHLTEAISYRKLDRQ